MKKILIALSLLTILSACNTVGGLGRDVSEAGDSLDQAAGWSQNQINEASDWVEDGTGPSAY